MADTTGDQHEQMLQDHHELRERLGEIHGALSAHIGKTKDICEKLESFSVLLSRHFDDEENDGFLDSVSTRTPRLTDRASKLMEQHGSLSEQLSSLLNEAQEDTDRADWWHHMENRFHRFSKDLMKHESAENTLLQESFSVDIGAED